MFSIIFFVLSFVISLVMRIAGATRLLIPLLYDIAITFIFPKWAKANPILSKCILYGLVVLVGISWIITLIRKMKELSAKKHLQRLQEEMALEELIERQGYYSPDSSR